jgi:hypothetical protein
MLVSFAYLAATAEAQAQASYLRHDALPAGNSRVSLRGAT